MRFRTEILKVTIFQKMSALRKSDYDFRSLYGIIHDNSGRIFCEEYKNFQIKKTTYDEMDALCKKTAGFLDEKVTDEKSAFVGLMMNNSVEWVMSFWGLLMAGYKPVLINDRLPEELNKFVCEKLNIKTLIVNEKTNTELQCKKILVLRENVEKCKKIKSLVWENEIALTSTATSTNIKICIFNGKDFTYQVMNADRIIKENSMIKKHYGPSLKLLTFLPFYHVFGLIATYFWFSLFGRTFVFLDDFSPRTIMNTIQRHKVTHVFAVPMLWHTVYREIMRGVEKEDKKTQKKFSKGLDFSLKLQSVCPIFGKWFASKIFKEVQEKSFGDSIKFMISGGGYITEETLKTINGIGYPLFNGYGMTEIGISSVELRKKAKYRILGSIGKPFESLEYKISDGTLHVRGKSICSRIITKDEMIEVNHDDWFDTKDLARKKDGVYYICGRKDDLFVSQGGEKINPDFVEASISVPDAKNFSFLGLDGKGTLVVEVDKESNALKRKKVLNEIEKAGKNKFVEKIFVTFDEIANKNAIKVSRSVLLKNIKNGKIELVPVCEFNDGQNVIKNGEINDIKEIIREKMANILGIDVNKISDDAHFIFDLNGESLDYLTLLLELEKEFDIKFEFEEKSCSTVNEFYDFVQHNLRNI